MSGSGLLLRRGITAAPDRLVLLLLWTCLVVSVTVLLGRFTPIVVGPLLLVVVVVTWRLVPDPVQADRHHVLAAAAALTLAATWVVVHAPYASTWLVVDRDPGFLTLEGLWLTSSSRPEIPLGTAGRPLDAVDGLTASSISYHAANGQLYVQGAKLLPGLLGVGGWMAGDRGVFVTNLVLGGLGLLAVYGLARRHVGPWWALAPMIALGTSVPMAAFSRSAYSEPLTVALAFGGLTVLTSALRTGKPVQFVVGGALVGATALVRIDGAAPVIGLVAALGIAAAARPGRSDRGGAVRNLALAAGAALAMVALGYLDLRLHSPKYLSDLAVQFTFLVAALLATTVVAVLLTLPRRWSGLRRLALRQRRRVGLVAVGVVTVVSGLLLSRPLWSVSRLVPPGTGYADYVEALQRAEDLPVDPTRSYDEMSLVWLSWYHGWPMVVLALAGLALLAWRALGRRDAPGLLLLGVVGAPSALYLSLVSITPDQIWAIRRFIPLTIPGFLVTATIAVAALWTTRRAFLRAVALATGASVAVYPLWTWNDLFTVVEQDGRHPELLTACDAIEGDRVLFLRPGSPPYLEPLRTVCDVDVVEAHAPLTPEQLADLLQAWGVSSVPVITFDASTGPWARVPEPVRVTTITTWPRTLSARPAGAVETTSRLYVGIATARGLIEPVSP